jgi:Tol biopolymer transport system component
MVCDVPDCGNKRPVSVSSGAQWTPASDGIAFPRRLGPDAPPNIWVGSLDGGTPRQLTHFTDPEQIVDFAWSPDGKRLAVLRGTRTSDIVLFKGLKKK